MKASLVPSAREAMAAKDSDRCERWRLVVRGVVQGVGFRPFVYNAAVALGLAGWVRNTSAGVEIEAEGPVGSLHAFRRQLLGSPPRLARIASLETSALPCLGETSFFIRDSQAQPDGFQPLSPDVAICHACRNELTDPADRRFGYPFTNCTECGPRFTIIRALPYDRPMTTMAEFTMCRECQAEYEDPRNRRFHAQPNACPVCGPKVWLESGGETILDPSAAVAEARRRLASGQIVAIKGIGGFHLACDASNGAAVDELRRRKGRSAKPFAVMVADLAAAHELAYVGPAEAELLASPEAPILLLPRRPGAPLAAAVAPGARVVGLFLPYSPLHVLLLARAEGHPAALVMTSGNRSEEPIVVDNDAARSQLGALADALLLHDRPIHARCDDSVMALVDGRKLMIRRARGFVPAPLRLPFSCPPLLACGAELKNTFCLVRDDYAFLSPHIGDLGSVATLGAYEQMVAHYETLFGVWPAVVAADLHPDYLATRYAAERAGAGLRQLGVQHHHAHIASCMAEHGLPEGTQVIGLAFDGTGYGLDGTIWGGEVLLAGYAGFQRLGHLRQVPLPGGEAAIRRPYRMALSWLAAAGLGWQADLPPVRQANEKERRVVQAQVEGRIRSPVTSSLGRLFDAVASLAGVCHESTYEGQAAVELEAILDPSERAAYPFALAADGGRWILDPEPTLRALIADLRADVPAATISARFHNAVVDVAATVCDVVRAETGVAQVCLSGGVFQNLTLLSRLVDRLAAQGFRVYWQQEVPPNDGGLALGQAVVAAARLRQEAE